tara:strand:- start:803 stop:916 length:114 start_codon:yes stop_codon:yes gene_type:complete
MELSTSDIINIIISAATAGMVGYLFDKFKKTPKEKDK